MCSTPVSGHIIPMLAIAKQLVARGYEVCFVSGSGYRQQVEVIGASFVSVEGYGDFYDLTSWDLDTDCMHFFLLSLTVLYGVVSSCCGVELELTIISQIKGP